MTQDIRINLLPWREALRQQQRREFCALLALMLLLAAALLGGCDRYYASAIQGQTLRNNFLASEVALLEARGQEVSLLREQSGELLARLNLIQKLQGHRALIVRVFDELARQLAPGVFFTGIRMRENMRDEAESRAGGSAKDEAEGDVITITGVAASNHQISRQLRNFSDSPWFGQPRVTAITADPSLGPQASRFTLSVNPTLTIDNQQAPNDTAKLLPNPARL